MARAKGPLAATLAAHNVTAAELSGFDGYYVLTCGQCGTTWEVAYDGGRLAPRYWECPNLCNAPASEAAPETEAAPVVFADLASLPAILTPAEAAALLRVSELTVKTWARAGQLPGAFKMGREWRVEREAILAYIGRASLGPDELRAALTLIVAETNKRFTLGSVYRIRDLAQAALTGAPLPQP